MEKIITKIFNEILKNENIQGIQLEFINDSDVSYDIKYRGMSIQNVYINANNQHRLKNIVEIVARIVYFKETHDLAKTRIFNNILTQLNKKYLKNVDYIRLLKY